MKPVLRLRRAKGTKRNIPSRKTKQEEPFLVDQNSDINEEVKSKEPLPTGQFGIPQYEPKSFRDGPEGMIKWCNEHIYVPIYYPFDSDIVGWTKLGDLPAEPHPETGKSYRDIWLRQTDVLREALKMVNGRFVYGLIVFCWMRGEGKSLLACIVQTWKFFNWPRQQIVLGANSKDQVKFVHFDIIRDIIQNSPPLMQMIGNPRNIKEKEIKLVDKKGQVRSVLKAISSFTGIVSNITGYTFSEIFDMKNPKFFTQLDGSVRAIPNALGVIDSTVSDKGHVLYQLFENFRQKKTKRVFFSHRSSVSGDVADYWNPNMTKDQLSDYKIKFPFGEFERYFLNTWEAGRVQVFTPTMIKEMNYLGCDDQILNHKALQNYLEEIVKVEQQMTDTGGRGFVEHYEQLAFKVTKIKERLTPMEQHLYVVSNLQGLHGCADMNVLKKLTDLFKTDWAILVGLDMNDPMAILKKARTIITVVAKGLPGSKYDSSWISSDQADLNYIYIILGVIHVEDGSINNVKLNLQHVNDEFDGVDAFCGERYGSWDLVSWWEGRGLAAELISPTYDRQRDSFKAFYHAAMNGRIKKPKLIVPGNKSDDILEEEMDTFTHDPDKRWFGSPEKEERLGVQDDSVFSLNWCIYGGRSIGPELFRERGGAPSFGFFFENKHLVGNY